MSEDAHRDLLLHPLRHRLVAAMSAGKNTAKALGAALPDIPTATLYRQIKKLEEAGVITVVDTRPARGAVERIYALTLPAAAAPRGDGGEALWLSDDELQMVREGIEDAIRPVRAYGPAPWRKRRVLAWVIMPADD
jgi:hypothetical protein